jgi:hypothetical protein
LEEREMEKKEDTRSDVHEITHALEAAGFEVYAVEHELDYYRDENAIARSVPNGVIKIKVKGRAKNNEG